MQVDMRSTGQFVITTVEVPVDNGCLRFRIARVPSDPAFGYISCKSERETESICESVVYETVSLNGDVVTCLQGEAKLQARLPKEAVDALVGAGVRANPAVGREAGGAGSAPVGSTIDDGAAGVEQ